jgi:hypothetical protein
MMTFFSKILLQDKKIELYIVYVLTPLPLIDYANTGKEQVKTLRKQEAENMLANINESLQGMGNPVSVCLLEGAPEKRIIEYVNNLKLT